MSGSRDFADRIAGQLLLLGPVEPRRMFGGWGLFLDGIMFALIADDRLYLKADAESEGQFEDAGCAPFTYQREGKTIALSYREAPAEALVSPDSLLPWARLGVAAARRNRVQKK